MRIADKVNENFDARKPWELAKDPARRDELQRCLHDCAQRVRAADLSYLAPVLPEVAAQASRTLALPRRYRWSDLEQAPNDHAPYAHLMTRIDPKAGRCADRRPEN